MDNNLQPSPMEVAAKAAKIRHQAQGARWIELLWFIESRRRIPGGVRGFCASVIDMAAAESKILPQDFHRMPANEAGNYTFEDAAHVWRMLPKRCRPSFGNPDPWLLVDLGEWLDGQTEAVTSQSAIGAGFREQMLNAFVERVNKKAILGCCISAAGEMLYRQILGFFSNPDCREFPRSVGWWGSEKWKLLDNVSENLFGYMDQHANRIMGGTAKTRATTMVFEAFEYACSVRDMVLVLGNSRYGKTYTAATYCEARPGLARWIKTPSDGGEREFIAAIAKEIGFDFSPGTSRRKMNDELTYVLQNGGLALAFDEAQFLIAKSFSQYTTPARLNWLRTRFIDEGGTCILLATQQSYSGSFNKFKERTGYAMEQWAGRIGLTFTLPSGFSEDDLTAVGKVRFPSMVHEALMRMAKRITNKDQNSQDPDERWRWRSPLHAMTAIAKRAEYLASKAGRSMVPSDVDRAADEFENGVAAMETGEIPAELVSIETTAVTSAGRMGPGVSGTNSSVPLSPTKALVVEPQAKPRIEFAEA